MEGRNSVRDEDFVNAKAMCGQFLAGNWTSPEAIEASILSGGYCNFLFLCKLKSQHCDKASLPHKVVVRMITGQNPFRSAGDMGETLVYDALARADIGPKLLGVFPGGRLEEFVEGRPLSYRDIRKPQCLTAAAHNLARMHSLNVPLRKSPSLYHKAVKEFIAPSIQMVKQGLKEDMFDEQSWSKLRPLVKADYVDLLDWTFEQAAKLKTRTVLVHGDHYANNLILKDTAIGGQDIKETDISIVDIEMASLCYRGIDIGLFLTEQCFDYTDTSDPQWVGPLGDDLKVLFVEEYLNRWKELNPEKFDADIDNVANVMKEQALLSLVTTAFFLPFLLIKIVSNPELAKLPLVDYMLIRQSNDRKTIAYLNGVLNTNYVL
ncbi:Choline/ethanolamine kinase [Halotydeus destructor]|nr:Choline/ethanolamine kinase [Halotydeus destructor]